MGTVNIIQLIMNNIIIILVVLVTIAKAELTEDNIREMVDKLEREVRETKATFEKKLKDKDDTIKTIEREVKKFEREVSFLKDPPYSFFCGYQDRTLFTSAPITYDRLLYSSTSMPDSATLDIDTGAFTS